MAAGNGAQRSDRIKRQIRSLHCAPFPAAIVIFILFLIFLILAFKNLPEKTT